MERTSESFWEYSYKDFAAEHKQEIWHSLISSVQPPGKSLSLSQPDRDRNFLSILSEGNFTGLNVYTLRRLVVWITQRSTGESNKFIVNTQQIHKIGILQGRYDIYLNSLPGQMYFKNHKVKCIQSNASSSIITFVDQHGYFHLITIC